MRPERLLLAVAIVAGVACTTAPSAGAGQLQVPAGFHVNTFAENVPGVRLMINGPDGAVYASESRSGRVVKLLDNDGDGTADRVVTVAEDLENPHGLAFRGDTLYVAEEGRVIRFVPGVAAPQVVVAGLPTDGGHSTRTIIFHDDHLYVSVGSSCNLCDERSPRRAAVLRFNPDGSGETVFASGLRNSVGLAVEPGSGAIWATNNDRDNLGDHLPPDRVNILREGGWYGWPDCYLPGTPNPEYIGQAARCKDAIGPAAPLPAHVAPLGLAFYTGTMFPAEYRGNLFVALHGSWNSSVPVGYKVVRLVVKDGAPSGSFTDFLTGGTSGQSQALGRPVGVLVAKDGALLVSDDTGGRIFRVSYRAN